MVNKLISGLGACCGAKTADYHEFRFSTASDFLASKLACAGCYIVISRSQTACSLAVNSGQLTELPLSVSF